MEWQDIETAPKDGTLIDLWTLHGERVPDCFFNKAYNAFTTIREDLVFSDSEKSGIYPTHWLRIRQPPNPTQSPVRP